HCGNDLLTEYLPYTLEEIVVEYPGSLSTGMVLSLFLDIARGVEALHGISPPIAHCDLMPDQVLIAKDGTAK
ncbi:unnamed protein product, partial [Chrysoparadoxa australica]